MSGLRDVHAQFADQGAQVLGISMDTLETQTKFAESLNLPFPLVADPEAVAAKAYGVANVEKGYANRVTFVIGKDGKIASVIEGRDAIDPAATLSACSGHAPPKPE
jgi:peroxiredoxin Q/BCP